MNTVCYGCTPETGRHIGCHATCEKYIQEKAKRAAAKAKQQDNYNLNTNGTYYSGKSPQIDKRRKFNK